MKRTWLFAAAVVAAGVAGCADAPYYDNGYAYDDYYNAPYPPYYVDPGPSVAFGFSFSDRDRRWDGHHWRDRDGRILGDRQPGRVWDDRDPNRERHWDNGGHGQSTDSRG
jgi:hypothetical protein